MNSVTCIIAKYSRYAFRSGLAQAPHHSTTQASHQRRTLIFEVLSTSDLFFVAELSISHIFGSNLVINESVNEYAKQIVMSG